MIKMKVKDFLRHVKCILSDKNWVCREDTISWENKYNYWHRDSDKNIFRAAQWLLFSLRK